MVVKNKYISTSLNAYAASKGIINFQTFKVSTKANQYSSDFVTIQLGDKKNKKTYLLQKLYDPNTNQPITYPYSEKYLDNRYSVYYQINPLGDGYKAEEHYDTIRPSVLNTEAPQMPVELSPKEVLQAIRGEIDIQQEQAPKQLALFSKGWENIQRPTKIIAGGQTGGDLGGLEGAKELGIETGGTAPPNFISGNRSEKALLESYGLTEGEVDPTTYVKRTIKNVQDSDGTLAILWGSSVGTGKTIGYAQTGKWQYGDNKSKDDGYRPVLVITSKDVKEVAQELREFISRNGIKTLNIAGHREVSQKGIQAFTKAVIIEAFKEQAPLTFEQFKQNLDKKDCS